MSGTARTKVTPKTTVAGRSPAEDVQLKMLCFHEAGHAVVGHKMGWHLLKMTADIESDRGQTHFQPKPVPNVLFACGVRDRVLRIKATRAAMAVVTAGPVAAFIHEKETEARGFSCRKEANAYSKYWEIPISGWLAINRPDDNPDSDYAYAVRDAYNIASASALQANQARRRAEPATSISEMLANSAADNNRVLNQDFREAIQQEIEAAERKAEKILRRSWDAVTDIAMALHKAKSGQLNRRQLLARLDKHGVLATAA